MDLDAQIRMAVKTGEVSFGCRGALKAIRAGKARLIVLASNPPKSFEELMASGTKEDSPRVCRYEGGGVKLGMVCGKPFAITVLTVKNPGDSEIMKWMGSEGDVEDSVDR